MAFAQSEFAKERGVPIMETARFGTLRCAWRWVRRRRVAIRFTRQTVQVNLTAATVGFGFERADVYAAAGRDGPVGRDSAPVGFAADPTRMYARYVVPLAVRCGSIHGVNSTSTCFGPLAPQQRAVATTDQAIAIGLSAGS